MVRFAPADIPFTPIVHVIVGWWIAVNRRPPVSRWFLVRMLEKIEDFYFEGRTILARRLGYRVTSRFVPYFFVHVFDNPSLVFDERILCPERQDLPALVDRTQPLVAAQRRVAEQE